MTKRVYEVAKDYGVSAKEVIKTLSEHNIKVGNFSGVDETMKSVLDRAYSTKKQAQPAQANAKKNDGHHPKNQSTPSHRPEEQKHTANRANQQHKGNSNNGNQNMKKIRILSIIKTTQIIKIIRTTSIAPTKVMLIKRLAKMAAMHKKAVPSSTSKAITSGRDILATTSKMVITTMVTTVKAKVAITKTTTVSARIRSYRTS